MAAVLLALAVLVVWDNQRIGAGWGDTGPQAGYFPLRVGAVLGICAIAVFVQALRSRSQEQFASWLQLRRVAQVLLPLTAYIAVIAPLGIYAASVLFITGFMVFAGRYPWWKAVALSGFTSVLLFYVFEIQFKVPLPRVRLKPGSAIDPCRRHGATPWTNSNTLRTASRPSPPGRTRG